MVEFIDGDGPQAGQLPSYLQLLDKLAELRFGSNVRREGGKDGAGGGLVLGLPLQVLPLPPLLLLCAQLAGGKSGSCGLDQVLREGMQEKILSF